MEEKTQAKELKVPEAPTAEERERHMRIHYCFPSDGAGNKVTILTAIDRRTQSPLSVYCRPKRAQDEYVMRSLSARSWTCLAGQNWNVELRSDPEHSCRDLARELKARRTHKIVCSTSPRASN
eukprot:1605800-Amphidinium_carterae.1